MKIEIPIEVNIKCKGKCSKCKWNQKPSSCSPWDDWRVDNKIPTAIFLNLVEKADEYFGATNLEVEE